MLSFNLTCRLQDDSVSALGLRLGLDNIFLIILDKIIFSARFQRFIYSYILMFDFYSRQRVAKSFDVDNLSTSKELIQAFLTGQGEKQRCYRKINQRHKKILNASIYQLLYMLKKEVTLFHICVSDWRWSYLINFKNICKIFPSAWVSCLRAPEC